MITSAFVTIWNNRVGAVAWDAGTGLGSFEYDPDFLKLQLDLAPVAMPVSERRTIYNFPELRDSKTFKGLPGLLADVLPDKYGNALINAWLAREGRSSDSINPVETLCLIGKRGMGALEFEPAVEGFKDAATKIEVTNLISIAEQILKGKINFATNLDAEEEKAMMDILKIGTSAGGARAKALIAYNPLTKEIRSGQTSAPKGFEHYIIKFDGVTDTRFGSAKGYGNVEMAYYLMASAAGIEMMESQLLVENGRAHFMTKRFDRKPGKEKLHVQTFCAMRHFDFNEINSFSYEQLFETMRMLRLSYPEAEQLYRRMVFNVLAKNCDDHTRNFAFLMDKDGVWKLAPAYDVCHAYRPDSTWVSQHCMSINGKRTNIDRMDLLSLARNMNIKKASALIDEITSVISNWDYYAKETGVNKNLKRAIEKSFVKI